MLAHLALLLTAAGALAANCPTPQITNYPIVGQGNNAYTQRPALSGSLVINNNDDPTCNTYQILVNGVNRGSGPRNGNAFSIQALPIYPAPVGDTLNYQVRLVRSSSPSTQPGTSPSKFLTITQCPQPYLSIDGPQGTTVYGQDYTVSGEADWFPECAKVDLFINGQAVQSTTRPANTRALSFTVTGQADGEYSVTSRAGGQYEGDGGQSNPSSPIVVTIANEPCPTPDVDSPQGTTSNTFYPVFAGSVDQSKGCLQIEYEIVNPSEYVNPFIILNADYETGQYSQDYTRLPNGVYNVRVSSDDGSGNGRPRSDYFIYSFTVDVPACPSPSINPPPAEGGSYEFQVIREISGTYENPPGFAEACEYITYEFYRDGQYAGAGNSYTPGGGTFEVDPGFDLEPASYEFRFISQTYTYQDRKSAPTVVNFVVEDKSCPMPEFTTPYNSEFFDRRPVLEGTQAEGDCATVRARLYSYQDGSFTAIGDFPVQGGAWSVSFSSDLPDGTYFLYVAAVTPSGNLGSDEGSTYFRVAAAEQCAAPTITFPETSPTQVSGQGFIYISGESPTFGTACDPVVVYVNGVEGETISRYSQTNFQYQLSQPASGEYTFKVRAGTEEGGKQSGFSNEVVINYTNPDDPQPTGNIGGNGRRRRRQCRSDESVCQFETMSGLIVDRCVHNLAFNIERCGSCDGPDCTEIPNVDSVECFEGACKVNSCMEGYELVDNRCDLVGFGGLVY